jgi:YVTN family beta-propeller protein
MQTRKDIISIGLLILLLAFSPVHAAKPKVTISASPATIFVGGSSTLTWTSSGATSASINQGIGSVPVNGSLSVSPIATTTYSITAKNSSGSTTAKTTVTVKVAPPTVSFSAAPTTIQAGQSSTLSWTTTNATSASINQGIGTVALNGTKAVTPTSTKTYTITVKGAGGAVTAQATVTVTAALPVVTFGASPATIQLGESSILTWTTANATSVSIDNGIGNVALNGSKAVTPSQTTTYTLTAKGTGGTVTAGAQVQVNTTPAPTITLSAVPQTISPGETSLLSWHSENADSVSIDNGVGDVATEGTVQVTPAATTTYTAIATNTTGSATATATVTIDNTLKPSATIYSSAEIVAPGGSTVLTWSSRHAQSASIDNGIGSVSVNGSLSVTPAQTTTYTLSVVNQNGTDTESVKVVVISAPKCYAYVPNSSDNTVSAVNLANSGNVIKTITVGSQPRGSVVSPDGTRVYIGNAVSNTISVIDTGSNAIISTINVNGGPKYLALHPGGRILYATLEKASSYAVAVINTMTSQVIKELDLGSDYLWGIALHPDGSRLYAAVYGGSQVLVIDTACNEISSQIPLRTPIELAVSPDGSRLYAIQGYSGSSNNVSIIDTTTNELLSSLRVNLPNGVAASLTALELLPDGSKLFVTISDDSSVAVINTSTLQVSRAESFAGYSPKCLAAHPDGTKVYVVFSSSNYLVYYYSSSNYVGGWISVGSYPLAYGQFVGYMAETAAGKVTQNGNGVAGVTLTITGEGYTRIALTDASGNFITALKNGTYTVTPSKGNMVFSPQSKQINVAQSITGIDFAVIDPSVPPTVSLSASPTSIQSGGTSTLSWTSTNSATAEIDHNVGAVPVSGSISVTPDATTTYTITVSNTAITATATAQVSVTSPPPTVTFSASPATIIVGGSSTLTWATTNAVSATIDNGVGSVPVNGSVSVSPTMTTTYTLTATGAGGSASVSVKVTVQEPPPTVTLFADPEYIPPNGSSTLTWTTKNATSASIDQGIGAVELNGSLAVSPTSGTTYTLTATGPGGSTSTSVTIKILEATLRGVWSDMKTAMQDGNISLATGYFSDQTRDKYSQIFTAIADQLPQIAQGMRDIEPVYFEEYGAKFRIKRAEEINGVVYDITYYIYFVQEEDGSWKILNY